MTTNKDFKTFYEDIENAKNIKTFYEFAESNDIDLDNLSEEQLDEWVWPLINAGMLAYGAYDAYKRYKEGDKVGAALSGLTGLTGLGGKLGKLGWAAAGADIARGDKSEPETPKASAPETPKAPETPPEPKDSINTTLKPDFSSYAKSKQFKTSEQESGGKKKVDKKKGISEALAEVQKLEEEKIILHIIEMMEADGIDLNQLTVDEINEASAAYKALKWAGHKGLDVGNYVKGVITGRGSTVYKTPGGFQYRQAHKPQTTSPNVQGPPTPVSTSTTTLKDVAKGAAKIGAAAGIGYAGYKGAQYLMGKDGEAPKADTGAGAGETTTAPTTTGEAPKTKTSDKMTFNQAFAKARQMAAEKGAKKTGEFEWEGKKYQTNIMGKGTAKKPQEKYVPMAKQTKVDIGTTAAPKAAAPTPEPKTQATTPSLPTMASPETAPNMKMPKNIGGDTEKAPGFSIKMPWETESGKTKGKRKMSEEYDNDINEAPLMGTASDFANFKNYNKNATYGQYLNTIRGLTAKSGGANDPSVIQKKFDAKTRPPSMPKQAWDPNKGPETPRTSTNAPSSDDSRSNFFRSQGIGVRPTPPAAQGRSISDYERDVTTTHNTTPPTRALPSQSSGMGSSSNVVGSPTSRFGFGSVSSVGRTSTESGGKKKVKESTGNSLIDSFLALQETKAGNVFEAAKKLKKNDGNLANNYPPYDKVTRGDVIAGRLGKDEMGGKRKVHEGMYDGKNPFDPKDSTYPAKKDPKDPSVQGSGDVTETPPKHVRPTSPERIKNFKDPKDPSVQGSGDVTVGKKPTRIKEDFSNVSFSDEEIAYFEAVMEAKAPEPPEENMSDGVSSKMDRKTLTDSKKVR